LVLLAIEADFMTDIDFEDIIEDFATQKSHQKPEGYTKDY
jgi:hypothetical protein